MTLQELDAYIARNILPSLKRFHDIDGAPLRIGQQVRVLDNPSQDDSFEASFSHQSGHVLYFEYDSGCGQTYPFDPMIGICFADKGTEQFWKEELTPLNSSFDTAPVL